MRNALREGRPELAARTTWSAFHLAFAYMALFALLAAALAFAYPLSGARLKQIQQELDALADGLGVPQVGANAFELARTRVDEVVSVTEEQIALAILRLVEMEKGVV